MLKLCSKKYATGKLYLRNERPSFCHVNTYFFPISHRIYRSLVFLLSFQHSKLAGEIFPASVIWRSYLKTLIRIYVKIFVFTTGMICVQSIKEVQDMLTESLTSIVL